ncbi:MAG: HAD family hydrolase, partial [Gammaproteobacteria bacterium]|nr:HAD family hydrolase [Gammaproteobacteria bacterium]
GLTVPVKAAKLENLIRQKVDAADIKVDFIEGQVVAKGLSVQQQEELIKLVSQSGFRIISDNRAKQTEILLDKALSKVEQDLLEQHIARESVIKQFFVDYAKGSLRLYHDESFSPETFVCDINNAGIPCQLADMQINDRMRNLRDYCVLFGTLMLITGTVVESLGGMSASWMVVPFFVALIAGLWPVIEDGIVGAYLKRRLCYASVVLVFVILSLANEMWFESAFVVMTYSIATFLERQFFRHIRKSFLRLRQLPRHAWQVRNDGLHCVPTLNVGDVICVKAGEGVFADGEIEEGSGEFRDVVLSEARRHHLTEGNQVYAGYRLLEGEVKLRVTRTQENSRWSEVLESIHTMINSHLPEWATIRQWTLLFSALCLGLSVALLWMMKSDAALYQVDLSMVLALLLVSGPVAVTSTTQGRFLLTVLHLAKRGIVVKKGEFISRLAGLQKVYVDKTGVITEGAFKLEEIISMHEQPVKHLLQIAQSLIPAESDGERYRAMSDRARSENISPLSTTGGERYGEQGFGGMVDGEKYLLGSYRLMKENGLVTAQITERLDRWQQDGIDVLFLANSHNIIGMFTLVDPLQSDVALSIDGLHSLGVSHQVLLTGDNEVTAEYLAHRMGYDSVNAECSSDDKFGLLSKCDTRDFSAIVSSVNKILMVPDLLKICVRAMKRNKEQRISDVFILGDDLQSLPELVTASAKTLMQLRNLSIVFIAYKLMIIAAVMAGVMPLWATMLSELLFIYAMWLAATREHFLQWTNPATRPTSLMQLPPPRRQRIFSPGLIR